MSHAPQGGQPPDRGSSGRPTGAAVPPGQIIAKARNAASHPKSHKQHGDTRLATAPDRPTRQVSQSPERHDCGPSSLAERLGGLQQQFDDEVTVAPKYDPRFLRRVAGPDYQSFCVCTYGGNIDTVDHHQLRTVARALALKAERPRERLGLSECAQNLVLAKARLARGWRFSTHPRTSLLQQPRIGSFA